MIEKIVLQEPGDGSVSTILETVAAGANYDKIGVAVAFASVSGINKLLDFILAERLPKHSFWLFGLDNYITHPDAIERAMKTKGALVRVKSGLRDEWIFHPKLFWFSDGSSNTSLVVGSANLTIGGLSGNCEAVVAMRADGAAKLAEFNAIWNKLWKLGQQVTPELLANYRRNFEHARNARKRDDQLVEKGGRSIRHKTRLVLTSDDAELDPSLATKCWIEVGKITGFKQDQLEIKAEQARFFGWRASGGGDQTLRATLVSGESVEITAHYFGNHMWRLSMPQSIPEVKRGLRIRRQGKLLRSSYVAVFTRTGEQFGLHFIKNRGPEFKALRRASRNAGTLGRTTTREYGWVREFGYETTL